MPDIIEKAEIAKEKKRQQKIVDEAKRRRDEDRKRKRAKSLPKIKEMEDVGGKAAFESLDLYGNYPIPNVRYDGDTQHFMKLASDGVVKTIIKSANSFNEKDEKLVKMLKGAERLQKSSEGLFNYLNSSGIGNTVGAIGSRMHNIGTSIWDHYRQPALRRSFGEPAKPQAATSIPNTSYPIDPLPNTATSLNRPPIQTTTYGAQPGVAPQTFNQASEQVVADSTTAQPATPPQTESWAQGRDLANMSWGDLQTQLPGYGQRRPGGIMPHTRARHAAQGRLPFGPAWSQDTMNERQQAINTWRGAQREKNLANRNLTAAQRDPSTLAVRENINAARKARGAPTVGPNQRLAYNRDTRQMVPSTLPTVQMPVEGQLPISDNPFASPDERTDVRT